MLHLGRQRVLSSAALSRAWQRVSLSSCHPLGRGETRFKEAPSPRSGLIFRPASGMVGPLALDGGRLVRRGADTTARVVQLPRADSPILAVHGVDGQIPDTSRKTEHCDSMMRSTRTASPIDSAIVLAVSTEAALSC